MNSPTDAFEAAEIAREGGMTDREALIAAQLASSTFRASDGYMATGINTNEQAADLVLAAGFSRQSPASTTAADAQTTLKIQEQK